jgi:mRNA degradation ribonuclease J1/J2
VVEETRKVAKKAYEDALAAGQESKDIRYEVMKAVERYIRQKLEREPLILPYMVRV